MTNTDLSQQENVWQTLVFTFNHLIKKYAKIKMHIDIKKNQKHKPIKKNLRAKDVENKVTTSKVQDQLPEVSYKESCF